MACIALLNENTVLSKPADGVLRGFAQQGELAHEHDGNNQLARLPRAIQLPVADFTGDGVGREAENHKIGTLNAPLDHLPPFWSSPSLEE